MTQPLGDFDDNCTLDLHDYVIFNICLSISDTTRPPLFTGCSDDIDLADLADFQTAFTQPWSASDEASSSGIDITTSAVFLQRSAALSYHRA